VLCTKFVLVFNALKFDATSLGLIDVEVESNPEKGSLRCFFLFFLVVFPVGGERERRMISVY